MRSRKAVWVRRQSRGALQGDEHWGSAGWRPGSGWPGEMVRAAKGVSLGGGRRDVGVRGARSGRAGGWSRVPASECGRGFGAAG